MRRTGTARATETRVITDPVKSRAISMIPRAVVSAELDCRPGARSQAYNRPSYDLTRHSAKSAMVLLDRAKHSPGWISARE